MSEFPDPFKKCVCTYCQEDISGLRVKCAECVDFTICLQCFSLGAEIGPHKNDHAYQFEDTGTLTFVGKSGWTANEELQLLQGIEKYGYGNWELIANEIKTKTPDEIKEEYCSRFLDGSIGTVTWEAAQGKQSKLADEDSSDEGPLGPESSSNAEIVPLDVSQEDINDLGYMPERDDFEKEYDNTAELMVSSLSITPGEDSDLDIALKLAQADMYVDSLKERARRKRIIHDYQLVEKFYKEYKKPQSQKKQPDKLKIFEDHFRVLCNIVSCNEHNQLLRSLRREYLLKKRVKELQNYRINGLRTFEECLKFDQENLKKTEAERNSDSSITVPPVLSPNVAGQSESENSGTTIRRYTCPTELQRTLEDLTKPEHVLCLSGKEEAEELLSVAESRLCREVELSPSQYMLFKAVLLTQGANGLCILPDAAYHVYAHLIASGWVTPDAAPDSPAVIADDEADAM